MKSNVTAKNNIAESMWMVFRLSHDLMMAVRQKELRAYGITQEYSGTLALIEVLGREATPTQIARWRYRRPHTVSKVLISMENEGLVTRTHDLVRRNVIRISLSHKGRQANEESRKGLSLDVMFSCLSETEIQRLEYLIEKLRASAIQSFTSTYRETGIHQYFERGEPAYNVWRVLRRVYDIISRIREAELSKYGVSEHLATTLQLISKGHGMATPASIAKARHRSPATISLLLNKMENDGLVVKTHDPDRNNVIRLALTAEGDELYRDSLDNGSIHKIFGCLIAEEPQEFLNFMTRLEHKAQTLLKTHWHPEPTESLKA